VPKLLIIGDDFTPSRLFREAIEEHGLLNDRRIEISAIDLDGSDYSAGPVDGIREFVGHPDELLPHVSDVEIIVTTFAPITRAVMESASSLRCVVVGRGGPVNVDLLAARDHDISVVHAPGRNAEAVAEYVVGLIIAGTRQIVAADRWVRAGNWVSGQEDTFTKPTGPELEGRTLGIIGMGAIGARVAQLMQPFHITVMAYDPYLSHGDIQSRGGEPVSIDMLLMSSDVITVHARSTSNSSPIIGHSELSRVKRGAFLINTSRGSNLDYGALLAALKDGRLSGAALDVLPTEPIAVRDEFLGMDNVVITPHAAGVSRDVPRHTAMIVAEGVAEAIG
jgi:D-3-phosphoglycerate dehydrogenase